MKRTALTLELVDAEDLPESLRALASRVATAVSDAAGLHGAVALRICSDAEMRQLNRQFRNVDKPTDVLAFPFDAAGPGTDSIGDVALSYERVVEQGREHGHGNEREFAYLVTHALLHLGGHAHDNASGYECMRRVEEQILASIGLTRDQFSAA
ncbi:MAG: rRNA maturation RNase YbeY [Chloroflexota bacterium]|nr:rRNA maturation RNase YbeY [Chloroflexota bacterium]